MDPCVKFLQNPDVDPETDMPLVKGSAEYNKWVLKCGVTTLTLLPPTTVPEPVPTPVLEVDTNQYLPQEEPTPEDFAITATSVNTDYLQAAIRTGREIYPSLDFYIQLGELLIQNADRITVDPGYYDRELGPFINRSNYPLFMRDACPLEIFKVYRGLAAEKARRLIRKILYDTRIFIQSREIENFILVNGFSFQYYGLIRSEVLGRYEVLSPKTFQASITPDQAILMEAWRKRVLIDASPSDHNGLNWILDLRSIQRQIRDAQNQDRQLLPPTDGYNRQNRGLKHFQLGFDLRLLYRAISNASRNIGPNRYKNNIVVDHLRYEGEEAIDRFGRIRDQKKVPLNPLFPKEYHMMLYNELMIRGLITEEIM
jgi:hypothetical protein